MHTGLSDAEIDQALSYAVAHQEEIEQDIFANERAERIEVAAAA